MHMLTAAPPDLMTPCPRLFTQNFFRTGDRNATVRSSSKSRNVRSCRSPASGTQTVQHDNFTTVGRVELSYTGRSQTFKRRVAAQ